MIQNGDQKVLIELKSIWELKEVKKRKKEKRISDDNPALKNL